MSDGGGWKTGGDTVEESIEGRVAGWLDRVPGYRGYRSKEDRRDADRVIRERIAVDLAARAARVEAVARELAAKRRLGEIGSVDEAARTIRHLIDRVRTASYGYGGLFSNRDVDERALDQLRLFDESLLSGLDALDNPIAALEQVLGSGGDLASAARAVADEVKRLHARLDLRGQVIETGEPAAQASIDEVLEPAGPPPVSPAFGIGYRDAISILGDDYVVDARIDVTSPDRAFRLFRLEAGDPERWLYVPKDQGAGYAQLTKPGQSTSHAEGGPFDEAAYVETAAGSGDGELATGDRASGRRPVAFRLLQGKDDPTLRAVVLDWQGETAVYNGKELHPADVEVFGAARS